jgi:hypothetical protein
MTETIDRRVLLKSGGAALGLVFLGGGVIMASDGAWALSVSALSDKQAADLMRMERDLFPHDAVDDGPYAKVAEALDKEAKGDPKTAALLTNGLQALDAKAGGDYAAAGNAARLAALQAAAGTPFFDKVRTAMVQNFYNDHDVWAKLGYEGSSAEKGGYIHRGFNDISWLPSS